MADALPPRSDPKPKRKEPTALDPSKAAEFERIRKELESGGMKPMDAVNQARSVVEGDLDFEHKPKDKHPRVVTSYAGPRDKQG